LDYKLKRIDQLRNFKMVKILITFNLTKNFTTDVCEGEDKGLNLDKMCVLNLNEITVNPKK